MGSKNYVYLKVAGLFGVIVNGINLLFYFLNQAPTLTLTNHPQVLINFLINFILFILFMGLFCLLYIFGKSHNRSGHFNRSFEFPVVGVLLIVMGTFSIKYYSVSEINFLSIGERLEMIVLGLILTIIGLSLSLIYFTKYIKSKIRYFLKIAGLFGLLFGFIEILNEIIFFITHWFILNFRWINLYNLPFLLGLVLIYLFLFLSTKEKRYISIYKIVGSCLMVYGIIEIQDFISNFYFTITTDFFRNYKNLIFVSNLNQFFKVFIPLLIGFLLYVIKLPHAIEDDFNN